MVRGPTTRSTLILLFGLPSALGGLAPRPQATTHPAPSASLARAAAPAPGSQVLEPGTARLPTATHPPGPLVLHLPVTAAPPDPLGIGNVSGFYSPGGWAAWFLTGAAAWLRIARRDQRSFNLNTWLFLCGTNWAAVDVFRALCSISRVDLDAAAGEAELKSHFGAFAAAYVLLFWGTVHGVWQFAANMAPFFLDIRFKGQTRRLWVLSIGLVLPAVALIATGVFAMRILYPFLH